MLFESTHIKGKGRGKPMGFPTINLKIPEKFNLTDGIYAARIKIGKNSFIGALHFGPIPTFGDPEKTLEVHLIDIPDNSSLKDDLEIMDGKKIKVEIVRYLRKVIKFRKVSSLVRQINMDVKEVKKII